jgi:hypothetical protein
MHEGSHVKKIIITIGALIALAVAGCSSAGSHSGQVGQAPINGGAMGTAPPASAAPFKITPVYCGKYSPAQVNQLYDYGGLVFKYTNTSTQPDSIVVRVNFVQGNTVLGSNVTAYEPTIKPGQSATAEVGFPANHMPAHFQCQVTSVGDHY